MAKKELFSLVAASLLAATLVGCGSDCRPGTDCTATPDTNGTVDTNGTIGSTDITATAPAYVFEAQLLKGSESFTTSNGGVYTWNNTSLAAFSSTKGAVDINENGMADAQDPIAPNMKAKAGYKNINPFTTLEAYGMSLDAMNSKYGTTLTSTDFDLTQKDIALYKAGAKATIEIAYAQSNGGTLPVYTSTDCQSIKGCLSNHEQITPCRPTDVIVCNSDANVSDNAEDNIINFPEELQAAFNAIDAAETPRAVNEALAPRLGQYNGFYAPNSDTNESNQSTTPPRP